MKRNNTNIPFFSKKIILTFFILMIPFFIFAQFDASFVATSPTSGCSPVLVTFDGSASTIPSGTKFYSWDFGNGNTASGSNLATPAAAYTVPGTYTVKLKITNGGAGSDEEIKTKFITVFAKPTADITTTSPKSGCSPFTVDFADNSKSGGAPITSWTWDFGGGSNSSLQNPTHIYNSPGKYDVSLVVKDVNGCQSNVLFKKYIEAGSKFPVDFSASGLTMSCISPFTVKFNDNSIKNGFPGPFTYAWDFGDGQTSSAQNPSHTYNTFGIYDVNFTVIDGGSGCSQTTSKTSFVTIYNLTPDFTANPTEGCPPLGVNFAADLGLNPSGTLSDQTISWNYGTGNAADNLSGASNRNNIRNPYFLYQNGGTYSVTMQTTGPVASCNRTVTKAGLIRVKSKPTTLAAAGAPRFNCLPPHTVAFTGTASDAVSYLWKFGDGKTSTLQNPSHTYTVGGSFNVVFYAFHSEGCADSVVLKKYIQITAAKANLTADIVKGCAPSNINFTDKSVSADPITKWDWNFGDGGTSGAQNPSHVYANSGIYTVSLSITTAGGCSNTITRTNFINIGTKPNASIAPFTPDTSCNPLSVKYINTSIGNADYYVWEPIPGTFFTQTSKQDLEYLFNNIFPRDYGVKLYAYIGGCADTFSINHTVTILPSVANFTFEVSSCSPDTVKFIDLSAETPNFPNIKWHWDFGTGDPQDTSNLQNPIHFFKNTGSYPVTLTVRNKNGCEDFGVVNVVIPDYISPPVSISAVPTQGCAPLNVTFNNTSDEVISQRWDFGNGQFSTQNSPGITYLDAGTYTVSLSITNYRGCVYNKIFPDYIQVYGPLANFDFCPATGCVPFQLTATDLSSSNSKIVSRTWTLGDGTTISGNDSIISKIYTKLPSSQNSPKDGLPVTLKVIDTQGCEDIATARIRPSQPKVDFTFKPYKFCNFDSLVFTAVNVDSTGVDPFAYFWDFGDGTSSTIANPKKIFPSGVFPVTLSITDVNNCIGSKTILYNVDPLPPVASFCAFPANGSCPPGLDSIIASCPPLVVNFKDQSTSGRVGIKKWDWNFGDGTTSNLRNPSRTYSVPGSFDVVLTITDSAGCVRTFTMNNLVRVKGPNAKFSQSKDITCNGSIVNFIGIPLPPTSGTVTFAWDFGDGSIGNGTNVSHYYSKPGIKYPTLIYRDETKNCTRTYIDTLQILGLPLVKLGQDTTFCNGNSINIKSSVSGANYLWNRGDTTAAIQVKKSGKYILTVTDQLSQCNSKDTVDVTVYPKPKITISVKNDAVCTTIGQPTGKVYLTLPSSDGPYHFFWTNGAGQAVGGDADSLVNILAGVYSVRVVNKFACDTLVNLLVVNQPSSYKLRVLNITQPSTCGGKGQIAVKVAADLGKIILPFDTVRLTNSKNEIIDLRTHYLPPLSDISGYEVVGTQKQADSLTLFFDVFPEIYSLLTVDSALGYCPKFIGPIKITPPDPPVVEFGPDATSCNPTYTLSAALVPNTNYSWSGPGLVSANGTNTMTTDKTGLYKLTVQNTITLCTTSDSVFITFYNKPGADIGKDVDTCVNNTITLTAATISGNEFKWYKLFNQSSFSEDKSIQISSGQADSSRYAIYIRDTVTGCTSSDTISVKFTSLPISPVIDSAGSCFAQNLTLHAQGIGGSGSGYIYRWTSVPAGFTSASSSITISPPVGITTYNLFITDDNNCISVPASTKVTVFPLPVADAGLPIELCIGKSSTLVASATSGNGSYTFIWDSNTSGPDSIQSLYVEPSFTADYYLSVIDSLGCSDKDTVNVKINALPIVSVSEPDTICKGSTSQLTGLTSGGSGTGFTFSWTSVPAGLTSTISNPVVSPVNTTHYNFTATDSKGCESTSASTGITINYIPAVYAGNDTAICITESTRLSAKATGGGIGIIGPPNYSFSWTSPDDPDFIPVATQTATSNPKLPGKYTYIVTVLDDRKNCPGSDTLTLTVHDLPVANAGPDQITCRGNQVSLLGSGTAGGKYIWYGGNKSISFGEAVTTIANRDTTFILVGIDQHGCSDRDSVFIKTYVAPVLPLPSHICIAPGSNTILNANPGKFPQKPNVLTLGEFTWYKNGQVQTGSNTPLKDSIFTTGTKGIYVVKYALDKCITFDTTSITPNPVVNAGADQIICMGTKAQLKASATGEYPRFKYKWASTTQLSNVAISNPLASPPLVRGKYTYSVSVTDSVGCISPVDAVVVNMLPKANLNIANPPACTGDQLTLSAISDSVYSTAKYQWFKSNKAITNADKSSYSTSANGLYSVIMQIGNCKDSTSKNIIFNSKPIPDNTKTAEFCNDTANHFVTSSVVLHAGNAGGTAVKWLWTSNIPLTSNVTDPTLEVYEQGGYYITFTNAAGCTQTDSIVVTSKCPPRVYIPNAFTPNGDDNNEKFTISHAYIKNFKIIIFNRWGEIIFYSEDPNVSWDGMYRGELMPTGTYPWTLEYEPQESGYGSKVNENGKITLIR